MMETNYSLMLWQLVNVLAIILLILSIYRIISINKAINEKLFWLIISIIIPILGPLWCLKKLKH